jgi:hypothetical protein
MIMRTKEQNDAEALHFLKGLFEREWSADSWITSAKRSHRAAEVLFKVYGASRAENGEPINVEDLEMDGPATLLLGYAIENAIKGYLIEKLKLDATKCKADKLWKAHDLCALFAKTGLKATTEQLLLLKTLTAFVLWAGKYPASFVCDGERGFLLPEQYDHAKVCKNMPPSTLDYLMRHKVDELFRDLLDKFRELNEAVGEA